MRLRRVVGSISDKKKEWRQVYKEGKVPEDARIQEATQRVLEEHVSPAEEPNPWAEVVNALSPYVGHLVVIGDLYDLKSTKYSQEISAKMRERIGPRPALISFSVHPSKLQQEHDPVAVSKFVEGAQELRTRMRQEGFGVAEDEILALPAGMGVGLGQLAVAAHHTSELAHGSDYIHVAVVDPMQIEQLGITSKSMPSTEDVHIAPFMLRGFAKTGQPDWTDISRPSPTNEI